MLLGEGGWFRGSLGGKKSFRVRVEGGAKRNLSFNPGSGRGKGLVKARSG